MLATIGIKPSEVSSIISLVKDSISQTDADVNTNFEKVV